LLNVRVPEEKSQETNSSPSSSGGNSWKGNHRGPYRASFRTGRAILSCLVSNPALIWAVCGAGWSLAFACRSCQPGKWRLQCSIPLTIGREPLKVLVLMQSIIQDEEGVKSSDDHLHFIHRKADG